MWRPVPLGSGAQETNVIWLSWQHKPLKTKMELFQCQYAAIVVKAGILNVSWSHTGQLHAQRQHFSTLRQKPMQSWSEIMLVELLQLMLKDALTVATPLKRIMDALICLVLCAKGSSVGHALGSGTNIAGVVTAASN